MKLLLVFTLILVVAHAKTTKYDCYCYKMCLMAGFEECVDFCGFDDAHPPTICTKTAFLKSLSPCEMGISCFPPCQCEPEGCYCPPPKG